MESFQELLDRRAFSSDIGSGTKADVLREIIKRALVSHNIEASDEDHEKILTDVLKREDIGSTGIGLGVAVPHTKSPVVKAPILFCAKLSAPCEFNALDGLPVDLLFITISSPDRPGDHLRALEGASKFFRDGNLLEMLRSSRNELEFGNVLRRGFEDLELVPTERQQSKAVVSLEFELPADISDEDVQKLALNSIRTLNECYRNEGGAGFTIDDLQIDEPSLIPVGNDS